MSQQTPFTFFTRPEGESPQFHTFFNPAVGYTKVLLSYYANNGNVAGTFHLTISDAKQLAEILLNTINAIEGLKNGNPAP